MKNGSGRCICGPHVTESALLGAKSRCGAGKLSLVCSLNKQLDNERTQAHVEVHNKLTQMFVLAHQSRDQKHLELVNEAIYKLYSKPIFHRLRSGLPTSQDAENLTQDVFLQFYRSNFRGECSILVYLGTIARNLRKDFFKSAKRREVCGGLGQDSDEPDGSDLLAKSADPAAKFEDQYLLRSAWLTLSKKDRLLLSGLPGTELAKILKLSQPTITRRRQDALARFRAALLDAGYPYPT